jgi:hypothetical protein
MTKNRFNLQRSNRQQGWWVCTDKVHNIVCRFVEHKFNDTQDFTLLNGETFETVDEALAQVTYLREMTDWLVENHHNKL